ncbi:MAG TPA: 3' terminal RNA ribose 2'-O-methyltransferase Hen1 [Chitinophagales bacterium]|nr:3' terminal RNA ribose 2'-O-methyltransferase Hen1 [Chitinophagales bacterium]
MLLTITTTRYPATDLSYMLHKHPAKLQTIDLPKGQAHIFYPEVSDERCTIAMVVELDPVALVRSSNPQGDAFALEQYVNDRPYAASSFMSAAIAKAFSSAMNGRCKDKPELVDIPMPFEVKLAVVPVRGGEQILKYALEPLGYTVKAERHELDTVFTGWGESRYYTVTLTNTCRLSDLLSHLYVLIPVFDNSKHYWVSDGEVEKLLEKGEGWLATHPAKDMITRRYLKNMSGLTKMALNRLLTEDAPTPDDEHEEPVSEEKIRLHDHRLETVKQELLLTGAKRILDLGCGEGKLLKLLLAEKQFEFILGMDVSLRALEIAKERLNLEKLSSKYRARIELIQSALTYRDQRLCGYDAAALVEVIEHLDESRLQALTGNVFGFARPEYVIITTPNREYNVLFESMPEGKLRHSDHRFEWTRTEFETWANTIAGNHGYTVTFKPVGPLNETLGAPTQMAIFKIVD